MSKENREVALILAVRKNRALQRLFAVSLVSAGFAAVVLGFLAYGMAGSALVGLFASAFIAATILPAQSEAVLVALLATGDHSPWLLVAVASIGNVLGAIVNWFLGRGIEHLRDRSWFPASATQLDRATAWYSRWGRWSLLLSWLPVGGDALTVVAGMLREPLWSFTVLVAIGKVARYVVVAAATLGFL